jgi:disulfide bond formation protein DsbB
MTLTSLDRARLLAILVPNALLWGAIGSQYLGGLVPCEMCMWQRWPHVAAISLALVAILLSKQPPASKAFTALAALAILVSGGIGAFHAGVEYGWWKGPEACTAPSLTGGASGADLLRQILAAPVVRCDKPQWMLAGISLAGYNAIISILSGGLILSLLRRAR